MSKYKLLVPIFLFSALFSLIANASETSYQQYMLLPIVEIYDGDTIKTDLRWRLPEPLNKVSIRLYGVDTPEMPAKSYRTTGKLGRAKCVKEAELAIKARDRVRQLADGARYMKITDFKWGRIGGRIVAKVKINGKDVSAVLIEEGYAVPYFGKGKKHDWCQ